MGRKLLYGLLKRQISDISHEKTWTSQRKGKPQERNRFSVKSCTNKRQRTNLIKQELIRCIKTSYVVIEINRSIT